MDLTCLNWATDRPATVKYPEPRPMSATVKARVERVAQKKEMLEIAFKAQAPPRWGAPPRCQCAFLRPALLTPPDTHADALV